MSYEGLDYIDYSGLAWNPPPGPRRVWRTHEGRKKTENGETLRFSIEEVPKDREDEVVDFMTAHFLVEEPTCVTQDYVSEPLAVKEVRALWKHFLRQRVSVVAFKIGSDPNEKPVIVGANMMSVSTTKDTDDVKFRSEKMKRIWHVLERISKEADMFQKLGVDRYLTAVGLSVDPSMRGQGLGEAILRTRNDIGKAYDIPVTVTAFTATASQILATRVGFVDSVVKEYSEILDDDGKVAFPNIKVKYLKYMYKFFN